MLVSTERIRETVEKLLVDQGVSLSNARVQANLLIEAELRGLPSHGLQRLPRLIARLRGGLAHPTTSGIGTWVRSGFLSVDGKRGLGPVVMMQAIEQLSQVVTEHGVALAGIRNANHIGMLAYYAEAAANRGLIAIILTTSEALVHPFGGTEAMLGTNPIAIGIPTGAEPFVLDLATSRVSMGKIHHYALTGDPIPDGWAVDAHGQRTTDPEAAKSGAIAPFGDDAKGYGLGLGIELLVAALAGSAFAPDVRGTLDATEIANKGMSSSWSTLQQETAEPQALPLISSAFVLRGPPIRAARLQCRAMECGPAGPTHFRRALICPNLCITRY